jgi:Flp pilus assembly protein TadB
MNRSARLLTIAAVVALLVIAVSLYLKMWGGLVLVAVAAAGFAWYRLQVARGQADQFFGDQGEDTRMTQLQAGSPSEMPMDRGKGDDTQH